MNPVNHIMLLADHLRCSHPDHYAETHQALRTAIEQALAAGVSDKRKIAEALRRHGLTLVETSKGYNVLKLGEVTAHIRDVQDGLVHAMLAAAPQPAQQAEWVGLTDEEKTEALTGSDGLVLDYGDYATAIEAKLREKNEVKK